MLDSTAAYISAVNSSRRLPIALYINDHFQLRQLRAGGGGRQGQNLITVQFIYDRRSVTLGR